MRLENWSLWLKFTFFVAFYNKRKKSYPGEDTKKDLIVNEISDLKRIQCFNDSNVLYSCV